MTEHPEHSYQTDAEWRAGRTIALRAAGRPSLVVTPPPEFHGPDGTWTPELLYTAAVNTCFATTFLTIAEISKLELVRFSTAARATLSPTDGRGYEFTDVVLRPTVVLRRERDRERAGRILEKAERSCFVSRSVKARVVVEARIEVEADVDDAGATMGERSG